MENQLRDIIFKAERNVLKPRYKIDFRKNNNNTEKKTQIKQITTTFMKSFHSHLISATFAKDGRGSRGRDGIFNYICHFQEYVSDIVAVSFIAGGNRSTRRKPQTCRKSLTNFIT